MSSYRHVIATGFFMGAADVVPGVSGGTVALLSGHYSRLINAIRGFGPALLGDLLRGRFAAAAQRIDLHFLVALVSGLVVGFALSLLTIKRLLETDATRGTTLALFAGLIVSSALLLARELRETDRRSVTRNYLAGAIGIVIAAAIGLLPEAGVQSAPSLPFLFLCGAIGICAMILPGISGAMILLLIGVYPYLIGMPHKLLHGEASEAIPVILVFGAGCATGLILFSRVLHWLLERHRSVTTALLVGLMIGSVVRLWPFREAIPADAHERHDASAAWLLPDPGAIETWTALAAFVVGIVVVIAIHVWATRRAAAVSTSPDEA
ncbi:MAG TPA: DUF368 domain-containing protein [Pirellulaceae bacterium]|nr:DUF368 domain-containing protein [Pirellulaceae bacterium]